MKMRSVKLQIKRKALILLAGIFIIAGIGLAFLWHTNQKAMIAQGQFALIGVRPFLIKDGKVYEYGTDEIWRQLEITGEAKQILRGENLCVLNKDGSLYYGGKLDLNLEKLPLTAAYNINMANMALKFNEEESFVCVNQNLGYENFRALLQNGDILYQGVKQYERYHMEEETPIILSGSHILTDEGNVYYFYTDRVDDNLYTNLECVYDGEDIVAISASETASRCLGLRADGNVVSWSNINPLEVTNWRNVVAIKQGFYYAVGLTDQGRVLYVDYGLNNTEAINKALKMWTDVVQIDVNFETIAGLKEDGSCYILDITSYK